MLSKYTYWGDIMLERQLYEYPYIMGEVKKLNDEKNVLASLKYDTSITTTFGTGGGYGGGISDKTGDQVVKIDELYDRKIEAIHKKIERLMITKDKIDDAIEKLDHLEKNVVALRYFKNQSWYCVASELKNSVKTCQRIKDNALEKLKNEVAS